MNGLGPRRVEREMDGTGRQTSVSLVRVSDGRGVGVGRRIGRRGVRAAVLLSPPVGLAVGATGA